MLSTEVVMENPFRLIVQRLRDISEWYETAMEEHRKAVEATSLPDSVKLNLLDPQPKSDF